MPEEPQELLFVTHPAHPLLSIHSPYRCGGAAFGNGVLADGAERFLWRIRGGGSGEPGDAVADQALVGWRGPGASPWPSSVEAALPSGRHRHSGEDQTMAGGNGLLCGFWLKAKERR